MCVFMCIYKLYEDKLYIYIYISPKESKILL